MNVKIGDSSIQTYWIRNGFLPIKLGGESFIKNPTLLFKGPPGRNVYYKALLKFPRIDYARSGHSNGWKVWKKIENLDGTGTIKVGDIVKVKVRFEAETGKHSHEYKYFVVDDPLPAGFVAINSAIATEEEIVKPTGEDKDELYNYKDETWNFVPNYLELRDERVIAFKNHFYSWGTYQFAYYARAVTEGEFILPSTKVQQMYSPDIHGYNPVSKVTILGR